MNDDLPTDTQLLDWMDAHVDLMIEDHYVPPKGDREVRVNDEFGDEVGKGPDLRAALTMAYRGTRR